MKEISETPRTSNSTTWTTGSPVLVTGYTYWDSLSPAPAVERMNCASDTSSFSTAVVEDGFGGVWKTIRETDAAGTSYSASATAYDPAIRAAKTIDDIVCAGTSGIPVEWCPNVNGSNTPATVTVTDALGRPLTVNTPRGTSRFECRRAHEFIVEAASRQYHGADIVWAQNAKGDLTRSAFDGDRVLAVDECSNSNATRTMPSSSGCTDLHRTLYGWPFFVHRQ